MVNLIYRIFGQYNPVTYTETVEVWDEVNQTFLTIQNDIIPSGLSGVDWPWLAGVVLFAITLYSFFRLIGGIFNGK